jgi:phospholipid-binding lipoprotein MlaA
MVSALRSGRLRRWAVAGVAAWVLSGSPGLGLRAQDEPVAGLDDEDATASVRDPIRPVNRGLYTVNDRLYFWVLKPVSTGYAKVVPGKVREGIGRMFVNLGMPRRGVNCLLQGKLKGAGTEVGRFAVNTTAGVLGFWDIADSRCGLDAYDEDFGQTLGRYGVGYGCFVTLPVFGPSNPRDTVGLVADAFLDPLNYLVGSLPARVGIKAGDRVNDTSLHPGEYEKSKETALDHYVWLRESYTQHRDEQIRR